MIPYIAIVRQYERMAVFTLGKYAGMRQPGLNVLVWPFQTSRKIDLREDVIDIPRQTNITLDNAPIDIDFLVYMRVDINQAHLAVLEVEHYTSAVVGLATTTLRAVVGDISLDEVLSQRERINELIRTRLDHETGRWGIKVTNVEIREIEPPSDIQAAMTRQMSAERMRRSMVLEADGQREAAITVAEGEKQSEILKAEGAKQSEILKAEGDQQAAVLRASGFADALQRIQDTASGVGGNTMTLQYMDALKEMAAGESTKFVLPMEMTRLMSGIGNIMGTASTSEDER
jgi:regulator of protease activity HflC (stomatin/prohibitin superfamily)